MRRGLTLTISTPHLSCYVFFFRGLYRPAKDLVRGAHDRGKKADSITYIYRFVTLQICSWRRCANTQLLIPYAFLDINQCVLSHSLLSLIWCAKVGREPSLAFILYDRICRQIEHQLSLQRKRRNSHLKKNKLKKKKEINYYDDYYYYIFIIFIIINYY